MPSSLLHTNVAGATAERSVLASRQMMFNLT